MRSTAMRLRWLGWAQPRRERSALRRINLVAVLWTIITLTMGCILFVYARTSVIHERYLLERAMQQRRRLQMNERKLLLSLAILTSSEQIEKRASKYLKLHYPKPGEVVVLP